MKLKVATSFGQRNPQWSDIILGNNSPTALDASKHPYSIGWYGCLITALGMLVGKNPQEVNDILKQNGAFGKNDGIVAWSAAAKALGVGIEYTSPRYDGPVTQQGIVKAKQALDAGKALVCEVDFNPATVGEDMHFVLCIGYNGDDFIILDPWTGTERSFDAYGGFARAVLTFRVFDKVFSTDTNGSTTVEVDSKVFENMRRKCDIADAVREKLQTEDSQTVILAEIDKLIKYEDAVVQKDGQLTEANNKIVELQQQVKDLTDKQEEINKTNGDLEKQIGDQKVTIDTQTENIGKLSAALEDLKKKCAPVNLTGWKKAVYDFLLGI